MKQTRKFILLILGAAVLIFPVVLMKKNQRPKYIFVNETDHHEHDLALKMSLKLAEKRSGIENSLVLLKELPKNESIEETAEKLFRRWEIGRDRGGKGLLYLYAEKENLFKIEVSYALEGVFPDGLCDQLAEGAKTFMLSEIPQDFLSELLITMNIQGQDQKSELGGDFSAPRWWTAQFLSGGAGVRTEGYGNTVKQYLEAIQRLPRGELSKYQPSADPKEVIAKYLESLEAGLGDPGLPLLTEGSAIFRVIVPRNASQQRRVLSYYRKAMPFHLFTHHDLGLAIFQPDVANLPIVLRHSRNDFWYIDEPKSWTYFHRFENQNNFFPKYADISLFPDLKLARQPNALNPVYRDRVKTPIPPVYPFSLAKTVESLESDIQRDPKNAALYAKLGEIYLFEVDWLTKSLQMFEKAAELDPGNLEYRWRLWDLYLNNSEMEKALSELHFLAQALPSDEEVQRWYKFYCDDYNFKPGEFL